MTNPLEQLMPEILAHQGVWEGEYQHIDMNGTVIDRHASRVECVFPNHGDVVYIQRNHFSWSDGRKHQLEFGGVIVNDRIWWDTETFSGFGWQAAANIFLLELNRKDIPGASFSEAIIMGPSKRDRARTWHWFKDGKCFKRTLCNEHLI
jgi:hypothetical protein